MDKRLEALIKDFASNQHGSPMDTCFRLVLEYSIISGGYEITEDIQNHFDPQFKTFLINAQLVQLNSPFVLPQSQSE
jgi:hypothetical protein